jgi:hypothetical protein
MNGEGTCCKTQRSRLTPGFLRMDHRNWGNYFSTEQNLRREGLT